MHIAMLSPIAWRTPPRHYGPWEWIVSLLTEGLVKRGIDVTLFATGDSKTSAKLRWVCPHPYEEDKEIHPKVWECLHISEVFEHAEEFDLIHNHFDFLPLTYSALIQTPVVTTIHGFSSPKILPVYKKYNGRVFYVAISEADKHPDLEYIATIHHGIPVDDYPFSKTPGDYLLVFGRIHNDKGVYEAIQVAKNVNMPLIIAGIIQDERYFHKKVSPFIDNKNIRYIGSVGPDRRGEILSKAFALLHLINFEEPFGLSVIEAMACGTPVIARRKGAMPELVIHGQTGFLVDSLEEAIEYVKRVKSIDRYRCRQRVEQHFRVENMVEKYIDVYKKVLSLYKKPFLQKTQFL